MSSTETLSATRQALLDAARGAARPFAEDEVFADDAAVIAAVVAAIEPRIRADERARLRSLVPYNANCCEGFPAAVADILGEHGDS